MLNKKDFKSIFLMEFRDIGIELAEFAYSRKLRTRKAYKEAISFLSKGGSKTRIDVRLQILKQYFMKYSSSLNIVRCAAEESHYI